MNFWNSYLKIWLMQSWRWNFWIISLTPWTKSCYNSLTCWNTRKLPISYVATQNFLKKLTFLSPLSRPYPFKFVKGCLPQNLLSPLLNALPHLLSLEKVTTFIIVFVRSSFSAIVQSLLYRNSLYQGCKFTKWNKKTLVHYGKFKTTTKLSATQSCVQRQ